MVDVGGPVKLTSDGGPQFKSLSFASFCKEWHIVYDMSSPHYPPAKGAAEAAVKAVKALVSKCAKGGDLNCDSFRKALMELRNTPQANGLSPAQVVFNRPIRSKVVAHPDIFCTSQPYRSGTVCQERFGALEEIGGRLQLACKRTSRP